MLRRMRRILPPAWAVALAVLPYALLEVLHLHLRWLGAAEALTPEYERMRAMFLWIPALGYGMYRVVAFHPLGRAGYGGWLRMTPWTADRPLPLGPVHLVPLDAVVVAAPTLLMLRHDVFHPITAPAAFLVGYVLCLAVSLRLTGPPLLPYVVGFGFGAMLLFREEAWIALALAAALWACAHAGLKRSLARFHEWNVSWSWTKLRPVELANAPDAMPKKTELGWPFDALGPRRPAVRIEPRDGLLLSLLAGWWLHVALRAVDAADEEGPGTAALLLLCLAIAAGRLLVYGLGRRPPLTLAGRLATGCWIIPGYDRILAAPACVLLIGVAAFLMDRTLALPVPILWPATLAAALLAALNMGPGLETWALTGPHRITPLPRPRC